MRITEVQAVLFESLDPADDAVPDGGLDVIVALDRHDIPWRVLPHRSAVRTVVNDTGGRTPLWFIHICGHRCGNTSM